MRCLCSSRSNVTLQQLFTYMIPVIPLAFAWDGAVSNARTYTLDDVETLVDGLDSTASNWDKGTTAGSINGLYLLGWPR